jgi:hypothetical protein
MIIVTGTKRSGTSMWMQALAAAGLDVIGERFPRNWDRHPIRAANPDGFYESELAAGIYFRTNPHPVTGVFLFPEQTAHHVVKVFIPGLIRTDLAFIDRVIATIRPWRAFARSRARMRGLLLADTGLDGAGHGPRLPAALEWWSENFMLIRDIATRRYAVHMVSYDSVVADPEGSIRAVLAWLGVGDPARACAAVRRGSPPVSDDEGEVEGESEGVAGEHLAVFDELYGRIHRGEALDQGLIERLNAVDRALRPLLVEHNAAVKAAALAAIVAGQTGDDLDLEGGGDG